MAGPLIRFSKEKFYDKPHLITPLALESIAEYLEDRNSGVEAAIQNKDLAKKMESEEGREVTNGVGVIPVSGALTYESTGWEALCGGASYQGILARFDHLADMGATTIVMDLDSPGGEAYGAFETSKELRKRADEQGIKLVAYVDGLAASAGYALAASAHEIISNPQSEVGSIGVVVRLVNSNKAMKKEGLETTYVYAGDSKVPFNEEGEFAEGFLEDLQEKVDYLYNEFTSFVAEAREMPQSDVIATQAKTFMASKAQELGLVDSLLTREEFFEKLAIDREEGMPLTNRVTKNGDGQQMSKELEDVTPVANADLEELQAKLAAVEAQLNAESEKNAKLEEQAKQVKLSELKSKADGWEFLANVEAYAEAALEGSIPVEMFNEAMDLAKEKLAEEVAHTKSLKAEMEALGEVGVPDAGEKPEAQIDEVEAELMAQGKIEE